MRYSMVSQERMIPVQQGPPPQGYRPHPKAPWWAGWVLAVITALGGAEGIRRLLTASAEQTAILVELRTVQRQELEHRKDLDRRVDNTEQRQQAMEVRTEKSFATLFAALAQEGYVPPRGAPKETAQVDWRPTKNARKPLKPVGQDGRELELPAVR